MACEACEGFSKPRPIGSRAELEALVEALKPAMAAGVLREQRFSRYDTPWSELVDGKGLPDIIGIHFRCPACKARFTLACETYHGGGGAWSVG